MEEQGVLLYYKFFPVADVHDLASWFHHLCSHLHLLGRLRIAPDGINVTLGGSMRALQEHIATVKAHGDFDDIDFKLSSSNQPIDPRVAAECGFSTLSVRVVKELITFGLHPSMKAPSISNAGQHVTAQQFHTILQQAGSAEEPSTWDDAQEHTVGVQGAEHSTPFKCVLIDARNIYETRIGKFEPPTGVEFYDPALRQYSDLPGWLDAHEDQLRNKRILMYCTGGVRCELASAYVRSKGQEFEDVIQLSGGIQRYLEAFADGGYFKGKNFVFDHRMAVGSNSLDVLGHCSVCQVPFDDYSSRTRCSQCRLLILVCSDCQTHTQLTLENGSCLSMHILHKLLEAEGDLVLCGHEVAGDIALSPVTYFCELCELNIKAFSGPENGDVSASNSNAHTLQDPVGTCTTRRPQLSGQILSQKLRILCLHGFRQNASSFKGRLSSLNKKLKQFSELVFVDAPHELPFVYLEHCDRHNLSDRATTSGSGTLKSDPKATPCRIASRKYAWLVSPNEHHDWTHPSDDSSVLASCPELNEQDLSSPPEKLRDEVLWRRTQTPFDPLQYQKQTEGWDKSWDYIQQVFRRLGPFDGVLGFSQGAAVAAALCPLRNLNHTRGGINFKFVVLCSGYPSPAPLLEQVMQTGSGIDCPSLHIYGEQDRQICGNKSEKLSNLFQNDGRTIVKHASGHIIPTKPEFVQQYVRFLSRFLS